MDIKNFQRDVTKIEAGEWVDQIPGMGDLRLRVRGIGARTYTAVHSRLMRAVPREDRERDNSIKPEVAIRIMGEAMAHELLLGWDGITDNGKPVPYDKALAEQWLTDPATRPFLDAVVFAAQVVENGRAAAEKALTKN